MNAAAPLPRLPYVLLLLMSVVSFGGPFVIFLALRGGDEKGWPPDRIWEWAIIALVLVLFVSLFAACVSIRLWFRTGASAGDGRGSGLSEGAIRASEPHAHYAAGERDSTGEETRR